MLPHNVRGGGGQSKYFSLFSQTGTHFYQGFQPQNGWFDCPPPQVSWNTTHFSKDFFSFFWQKLRPMSKDFLWITNPLRGVYLNMWENDPDHILCIRCFKDRQMGHYVMVSFGVNQQDFSFFKSKSEQLLRASDVT